MAALTIALEGGGNDSFGGRFDVEKYNRLTFVLVINCTINYIVGYRMDWTNWWL